MPEKAGDAVTLHVPIDASAIMPDKRKEQALKVVVKTCEGVGELRSESVKLKADGTGLASFSFPRDPGPLTVLVGPERAEDLELASSQTLQTTVAQASGKRNLELEPFLITPYFWEWWLRWCREFKIHGRLICADGDPVPGAQVCAYDVDWWWWWWTKQQVGCATTDINGSFEIDFRWCCGFWPWWWWRYRFWEFAPEIAELISPVLERDPQLRFGRSTTVPSLDVFKPALSGIDDGQPLESLSQAKLEEIRGALLDKLPRAPELERLHIWPWWPWRPWWDCTPDIIFRATQDCHFPGAVILNESYNQTRWDIATTLNVTLVANELACCRPKKPCAVGDCIEFSTLCSDEGILVSSINGNTGPLEAATPVGYEEPGDRAFSGELAVLKGNDFSGIDYVEVEVKQGPNWVAVKPSALPDFCRVMAEAPLYIPQIVNFQWNLMHDGLNPHNVIETREHWDATHAFVNLWYWQLGERQVFELDSTQLLDNTYTFRVVGWQDAGGGQIKNGHVLLVCGTKEENHLTLALDNRVTNDPAAQPCQFYQPTNVHICTFEPSTAINSVKINGQPIPVCGTSNLAGTLEIDFEVADPDGHLQRFELNAYWGNNQWHSLLGLPGATLTLNTGDAKGPDYATAITGVPQEMATRPYWYGGTMTLTVPAVEAFPDPCCYLIALEAWKRHELGVRSGCGYGCWQDQFTNISEFTVGVGVCDALDQSEAQAAESLVGAAPTVMGQ